MAKVTHVLTNFSGGELSPRLRGRTDIKKYGAGLRTLENFDIVPHGGARKRSGTRFVCQHFSALRMVPFVYSTEQSYCLGFGHNFVWFFKDRGIITQTPVAITGITQAANGVVTATAHGLTTNDYVQILSVGGMTELNNRLFQVTVLTGNTFELNVDTSGYTAYTSGGTVGEVVSLATTYSMSDVDEMTFAQVYDTFYIAHRSHPLRKITRFSDTSWTLTAPTITTGPFRTINSNTGVTITPSAFSLAVTAYGTYTTGTSCTLTASGMVFDADMVGGLFRLNEEGGIGVAAAQPGASRTLSAGSSYTNAGNVYGVASVAGTANWTQYTRVPDHNSGRVRVFGPVMSDYFDSDFLHPGYCIVRITAVASATSATAEIVRYQMPEAVVRAGTSLWEEGAWSPYRGYPGAIAFYEQRMFLAGSTSEPSVVWGSRSGGYEDFTDGSEDDKAVTYRIAGGSADVIRWLASGRVLMAGTSASEFAIAASNQNEALTPTNFKAVVQTSYGTSDAHPIRVNQLVLYPQRDGAANNPARKLREYQYSYADDAFESTDLTIFSEHIMGNGFTEIAYELVPDSVIWCLRTDGTLASCTYERAQEIVAWGRHSIGGSAEVQSICVIPSDEGDELWLSVLRNGAYSIEVMMPPFIDDGDKEDAILLDSSLTYEGTSTSTLSGLWHLRNQAVKVLNNGSVESHTVTAAGRITLNQATTKAHIGYGYTAVLETQDLEAGAQAGTAQSRAKRISQVYPRLVNSLGGSMGPDASNQKALLYRRATQPMDSSPPLFTGIAQDSVDFPSGWDREAVIRLEHSDPLPFHVIALVAELSTSG
jgi:hypothetical protein